MALDPQESDELRASAQVLLKRLTSFQRAADTRAADEDVIVQIERARTSVERTLRLLGEDVVSEPFGGTQIPAAHGVARHMIDHAKESEGPIAAAVSAASSHGSTPQLQGSTVVIGLAEVMELLGSQEKTGELTIETEREEVSIHLRAGKVIHASSNHAPVGDRLGDLLVSMGYVSQERLDVFLKGFAGSGRLLGDLLATGDVVSAEQLSEALTEQVQRLFCRIYAADEARYRFVPADVEGGKFQRVDMGLRFLLFESARQLDEARNHGREQ